MKIIETIIERFSGDELLAKVAVCLSNHIAIDQLLLERAVEINEKSIQARLSEFNWLKCFLEKHSQEIVANSPVIAIYIDEENLYQFYHSAKDLSDWREAGLNMDAHNAISFNVSKGDIAKELSISSQKLNSALNRLENLNAIESSNDYQRLKHGYPGYNRLSTPFQFKVKDPFLIEYSRDLVQSEFLLKNRLEDKFDQVKENLRASLKWYSF